MLCPLNQHCRKLLRRISFLEYNPLVLKIDSILANMCLDRSSSLDCLSSSQDNSSEDINITSLDEIFYIIDFLKALFQNKLHYQSHHLNAYLTCNL